MNGEFAELCRVNKIENYLTNRVMCVNISKHSTKAHNIAE